MRLYSLVFASVLNVIALSNAAAFPTTARAPAASPSPAAPAVPAAVSAPVGLISGFDDVLRQAEVQNLFGAAYRIFLPDIGFAGMPELYQGLTASPGTSPSAPPGFTVISGITSLYAHSAAKFLKQENYPPSRLYFRNWITEWSIDKFKIEKIGGVLAEHPQRQFVFIFDNSPPSFAIADQLHKEFSSQTAAIYLRQTVKKPLPAGTQGFFTAFDIAVAEERARRLTSTQVIAVAEAILREPEINLIIPAFAECPEPAGNHTQNSTTDCADTSAEIQQKCEAIAAKITKGCVGRKF